MRTRSPGVLGAVLTLLGLLACSVLAGCGDDAPLPGHALRAQLRVTVEDWSSWRRDRPRPSVRTELVAPGDGFTVRAVGRPLRITVTSIGGHVGLETSAAMVPASHAISCPHRPCTATTFSAEPEEPIRLDTPSTDGGTTVTIEVVRILGVA